MATGYLCAGTVMSLLSGLPLFARYMDIPLYAVAAVFAAIVLLSCACAVILIRLLVPRYGAKAIYEQDILILMIGLLFMALTLNPAMFVTGVFVSCAALFVFFYENFRRQIAAAREGFPRAFALLGWGIGPVVTVLALWLGSDYGLIVARVLFAHFIVIAFWVWIQRLSLHEDYADAPSLLTASARHARTHDKAPAAQKSAADQASESASASSAAEHKSAQSSDSVSSSSPDQDNKDN